MSHGKPRLIDTTLILHTKTINSHFLHKFAGRNRRATCKKFFAPPNGWIDIVIKTASNRRVRSNMMQNQRNSDRKMDPKIIELLEFCPSHHDAR